MKKNELTNIIRDIVSEEIRRELPNAIAEVFQTLLSQKEPIQETKRSRPTIKQPSPPVIDDEDETLTLKESMREMFSGASPVKQQPQQIKRFSPNDTINEILNSTRPFTSQERHGAGPMSAMVSGGNFQMNSSVDPGVVSNPLSQQELMSDNHTPLSDLPENVSALDVAQHVQDPAVVRALTRNYSSMMKLVDKKKGKI
jgi:hypothetical protein